MITGALRVTKDEAAAQCPLAADEESSVVPTQEKSRIARLFCLDEKVFGSGAGLGENTPPPVLS